MVNLLGRPRPAPFVVDVAPALRGELQRRLRVVAALARIGGPDRIARSAADRAGELEELEVAPSRAAAEALLDALDGIRSETLRRWAGDPSGVLSDPIGPRPGGFESVAASELDDPDDAGLLVGHRPGRSLATGEAEIASRGYFDVQDRPPLEDWIGVLPGADATAGGADFWIVAWVAPSDAARARAGCRACPNGALILLEAVAPGIAAELMAAVRGELRACGSVASPAPGSAGRGRGRRP